MLNLYIRFYQILLVPAPPYYKTKVPLCTSHMSQKVSPQKDLKKPNAIAKDVLFTSPPPRKSPITFLKQYLNHYAVVLTHSYCCCSSMFSRSVTCTRTLESNFRHYYTMEIVLTTLFKSRRPQCCFKHKIIRLVHHHPSFRYYFTKNVVQSCQSL